MSELDWAVGLYEGEGSCTAAGRVRRVELGSADEEVVLRFAAIWGCGYVRPRKPAKAHYKPSWVWRVTRWEDVERVARILVSHPMLSARRRGQLEYLLSRPVQTRAQYEKRA